MKQTIKIVAALACRNTGKRLYAKPLQRLGEKTILQHIIDQLHNLRQNKTVQGSLPFDLEIVLGIAEGIDNLIFQTIAKENKIGFIVGNEKDVQFRLLQCAHLAKAEIILRLTTESPFVAWEYFESAYRVFREENCDFVTVRNLPDGSSFELIRTEALKRAHDRGNEQTRSELCTKYLFTHPEEFQMKIQDPKEEHQRHHYRLTVDYADDLVVCNKIYTHLTRSGEFPLFDEVLRYVDQHPELMQQLAWIDGSIGRQI